MSEQQNRDILESQNIDAIDDLIHDDYVEEYPQSGERIRGKDNARTVYENYPGIPNLIDYGYRLEGDLAVAEMILDYDRKRMNVCEIVEFEDGKIKLEKGMHDEEDGYVGQCGGGARVDGGRPSNRAGALAAPRRGAHEPPMGPGCAGCGVKD